MKASKNGKEMYPIYVGDDEHTRFKLGTKGGKTLIVFGLNPSTAKKEKSDLTISKVKEFANRNGFDSFVMLNLYAQRTPHPDKLDLKEAFKKDLHDKNLQHIIDTIENQNEVFILAAWGGKITIREYFVDCLHDIHKKISKHKIRWLKIGESMTKSGNHPKHPSRVSYENSFTNFIIEDYLKAYPSKKYKMQKL